MHIPAQRAASRAAAFREMFRSRDLEFIIEAHNGLSAKIAEEAGFKGVWVKKRLEMDKPVKRLVHSDDLNEIGYDAILSKFHNPFEVTELFENNGFDDINLLWYHYLPAMPPLEEEHRELFRREALKLEHNNSKWKGLFLCSAFVVEAQRTE